MVSNTLTATRTSTAADWASSNPILAKGEVGLESDTGITKVGNGLNHWSTLNVAEVKQTSAQLALLVSDETGTGVLTLGNNAAITTPTITSPLINPTNASTVGATIQGAASQTANLLNFKDSTGAIVANVDSNGSVTTGIDGVILAGSTSGTTQVKSGAVAGTSVLTLPVATDTLVGKATTDTLTNKTLTAPVLNLATRSATNAIAASATQTQAAGTALTTDINRVVTIATTGDAVTLPAALAGKVITVINAHATNAVGIFPAVGDAINALAANSVYSLAATKSVQFFCAVAGTWNTILSA